MLGVFVTYGLVLSTLTGCTPDEKRSTELCRIFILIWIFARCRRCAYAHRKQCVWILKMWCDVALRFSSGLRPALGSCDVPCSHWCAETHQWWIWTSARPPLRTGWASLKHQRPAASQISLQWNRSSVFRIYMFSTQINMWKMQL